MVSLSLLLSKKEAFLCINGHAQFRVIKFVADGACLFSGTGRDGTIPENTAKLIYGMGQFFLAKVLYSPKQNVALQYCSHIFLVKS